jgi:predicted alpha/beta hydrolase
MFFAKPLTLIGLFDGTVRFALVPRATKLAALTGFGCSVFRYRGCQKSRANCTRRLPAERSDSLQRRSIAAEHVTFDHP